MKKIIPIALVFCLMLIVVGCGSQESGTETTEEVVEEVVEEEKGSMGSTESAKQNLLNTLSKIKSAEYLVEYDVETETFQQTQTGGSVKQTMKATQTIVQKDGQMKVDSMQNINGKAVQSMFYLLKDGAYICAEQDGKFACFGGSGETKETSSSDKIQENAKNYPIVDAGTITIAGVTAKCFKIMAGKASYDDEVMTGCYSDEGVPLYIKTEKQGEVSIMEATKYLTSVDDSEFELPTEPTGLSGFISPTN